MSDYVLFVNDGEIYSNTIDEGGAMKINADVEPEPMKTVPEPLGAIFKPYGYNSADIERIRQLLKELGGSYGDSK